ncbi:hypothetical protein ACBR40_23910 [Nonomuraea sp. AD125B]|uniref:hypothetical protein n=1 Tax=Nonomuraea sp. AD125B TaxID=3242897 RepID=UPI00352769B2
MTATPDHTGPGDAGLVAAADEVAGGREVMPKRAAVPMPWTRHSGTGPAREAEGRSQAAKTAAVAVGMVLLTLAGVLIGIPAFRTTLDPVPYPGSVPPTPPAAALRRSPAATAPPSATTPPPVNAAPVTTPAAPATPSAPPSSRLSSQPVATATYPTTPGIVRPQGARNPRARTARPRAIRPQPVRPRKRSVVVGTSEDSGTPAPTTTTTPPDATLTPAPQVPGRLKGQAAGGTS